MEIEFFGGNCFRIKTKDTVIVLDDNLEAAGKKTILNDKSAAFYTQTALHVSSAAPRLMIDYPGEFEVGDITVKGVQARAHTDEEGKLSATVFQFIAAGMSVSAVGHIHPDLSPEVQEMIGGTDVLIVPVGGNGFTLDPIGAASIIKKAEAGVVIPSQYEINGFSYEVPAQPLEEFAKVVAVTFDEPVESFKPGAKNDMTATATQTRFVILQPKQK
jgi:L-ascorbate metabolism protein UlaG (beta-lactamase superfamily)